MSCIFPHQMFQADFLDMLREAKRQEEIDPFNDDEFVIGQEIFYFFAEEVLPLVKAENWVFEAAQKFAIEYADEYFIMLRLLRSVEDTQKQLAQLREEVTQFIKTAMSMNCAPKSVKIPKPSDFASVVELEKMPTEMQKKASQLYEEATDLEYFYVNAASQAIQAMYEKGFSRIFFVANRALKVRKNSKRKSSYDNSLRETSEYINWCKQNLESNHILSKLYVDHRIFYKVIRNVDSHHKGPKWLPKTNQVYLPDRDNPLTVDIIDFSQRYRYLMYFCEMGVRGILAIFCDCERGPIANAVKDRYLKMYDNPELKERICDYEV